MSLFMTTVQSILFFKLVSFSLLFQLCTIEATSTLKDTDCLPAFFLAGGVKHKACGRKLAPQRVSAGPLDDIGKCEGLLNF